MPPVLLGSQLPYLSHHPEGSTLCMLSTPMEAFLCVEEFRRASLKCFPKINIILVVLSL